MVHDIQAARAQVNVASAGQGQRVPAVVHVSPTYFAPESILGGGERFAEELARAMSARTRVRFVAFGRRSFREQPAPNLERVILKSWSRNPMLPMSMGLFGEIRGAAVIHCHQLNVLSTFLAAWWGARQGSRVFVSDLGGGGWTPGYQIDIARWITAQLPISRYAARGLAARGVPHTVIHGGVDLARYPCRETWEHDGSVVFLGRILPHKGIHFLVEGVPPDIPLHVIGPVVDPEYRASLGRLAERKRVLFHSDLPDAEVRKFLRHAMVLVHPTPVDSQGSAGVNELFGLALVEAMACGCPVIASNAASLPEIVRHEEEGLLVPPNNPAGIRAAIGRLSSDRELWRRLAAAARRRVETHFTWDRVVDRCLDAYKLRPVEP